ncbi:MAG: PAS domain S-box protein [Dehalococcoidia bacterium]|nr:PAS domain S-box protein [Dehalococcoidia bacterium]
MAERFKTQRQPADETAGFRRYIAGLEARADMLDRILAHTPHHFYVLDMEGRFLFANTQGAEPLGLLPEDMLGKTWRDLGMPAGVMESPENALNKVLADQKPVTGQMSYPTVWGPRDYEYVMIPIRDEQGRVCSVLVTSRDITETKKMESRAHYQASLIDCIIDAVLSTDLSFVIKGWNTGAELLYGWKAAEVIGKPVSEILAPEYPDDNREEIYSRFFKNGHWTGRIIHRKRDGSKVHVSISVALLKDGDGNPTGTISIMRDITPTVAAETAIQEARDAAESARDWLEVILKTIPSGVVIIEKPDGRISYVNDSAVTLYGVDPRGLPLEEHSTGVNLCRLDGSRYPPEELPASRALLKGEVVLDEEIIVVQPGGNRIAVTASAAPVLNQDGEVVAAVGIFDDITGRKRFEDQLKFQANILSHVNDAVVAIDRKGLVSYWNKPAEELFGLSADEAIGLNLEKVYTVAWERPEHEKAAQKALDTIGSWRGENIHITREGKRIHTECSASVSSYKNGRVTGLLTVIRDITERKMAERVKDEFIGMVSHELKTPLTVIIGALSTATAKGLPPEESAELLQDAVNHAEYLAGIVDNLLELSRHQAHRLVLQSEPVSVETVARDVLVKAATKSSRHRLVLDFPDGLPPVKVDPMRVERVVYNLVDNAIKYSPNGGQVTVAARQGDDCLVLAVRDQGMGIPLEDQARLFKGFERLETQPGCGIKGIGLGLNVCRILVEAHGGRIWVESEPGKGSSFFFTLPLESLPPDN